MNPDTTLRVARPTGDLQRIVRFYTEGLGLTVLGSFEDHRGFDGAMVGLPGGSYHLEFTRRRGHSRSRVRTQKSLLVFYMPDREHWRDLAGRMRAAGYRAVSPSNPYWDRHGVTFEDPDGNCVVLENSRWSP